MDFDQSYITRIVELEKKVWRLERSHNQLINALKYITGNVEPLSE